MASLDLTSFQSALKTVYSPEKIENLVYKKNPFFAMVPKWEQFGGENFKLPIQYSVPQGRSATFSTAASNKTSSKYKAFLLTRDQDYALASIDNETIEASMGNANAFMQAATSEIDAAILSLTRSAATALYGSGSGSVGQCLSAQVSGDTTITLKQVDDVTNFEVGMEIVFSTANGGGSLKAGSVTVVGVNRDSGVITVDNVVAIASGAGVAANDYIFVQGDYDGKLKGLSAWLPASAPSSSLFFNVDRTADPTRLAGIRYDGSAQPIEEALIDAAARVAREGGSPDHIFLNYSKYSELEKALGSKVQYVDTHINPEIGFRGMLVHGPHGTMKVIPDQNCPANRAFMLQLDTWKLYSLGKVPKIIGGDGLKMLRESNADSVEVRVGYYAQLGCKAPGYNANILLS